MAQLVWKDTPMETGPPIPTSLTPAETAKLRELAEGKVVLEVGSAYGYSAIHMAQAGARHVFAVDPHAGELPNSLAVMQRNLVTHGVAEKVTILLGFSQAVLPALDNASAAFGLRVHRRQPQHRRPRRRRRSVRTVVLRRRPRLRRGHVPRDHRRV